MSSSKSSKSVFSIVMSSSKNSSSTKSSDTIDTGSLIIISSVAVPPKFLSILLNLINLVSSKVVWSPKAKDIYFWKFLINL